MSHPKNTVYSIKRFMGETYAQSQKEAEAMPYTVVNEGGYPRVEIEVASILHRRFLQWFSRR